MRPRARVATAAAALALTAAGCGGAARAPLPEVDGTTFAPALGVDLAAGTRTASGLVVIEVRHGDGARAEPGRTVAVGYSSWLANGTYVDGAPAERPLEFALGGRQAIRGMEEGVRGMRVGGRRRLVVPPTLAYGREGRGPVPPNAVLVFDVELVRVR